MTQVEQTATGGQPGTTQRRARKARVGTVLSHSRDKTLKVAIDRQVRHQKYGKYLRHRSVLHVHDEKNEARTGDVIEITECRPISKTKSWRLSKIVRRGREA